MSDFDARPKADFSDSELQLPPPNPCQGKNCAGTTQSTSKTSGYQEVSMGRGQKQETTETRECGMKELFHFVNQYHQLPGEPLPKWIVRVTTLEAVSLSLVLVEEHVWVDAGPTGHYETITDGYM